MPFLTDTWEKIVAPKEAYGKKLLVEGQVRKVACLFSRDPL
jgi:hypothetical protein